MRSFLVPIYLILALAFCAKPQDLKLPDLTGTWALNLSKSKLPRSVSSMPESVVIVCSDQTIQFTFTFDGRTRIKKYITDGQEHTERVILGRKLVSKALWKNSTLEIENSTVSGDDGRRLVDRKEEWQLAADGQTLTRVAKNPKSVSLYDKQ